MKNLKDNLGNLVMSLCEIVIGIILLVKPVSFTTFIITALGIVMVIRGIFSIISYFREKPEEAAKQQSLAAGLVFLAAGLFCTFNPGWFIDTFPALSLIYGILILLTAITKIQWTVDCLRMKKPWLFTLISAVLSLVSAIIIIWNPFASATVLWLFAGVSLIVEAIFDIVSIFFGSKKDDRP